MSYDDDQQELADDAVEIRRLEAEIEKLHQFAASLLGVLQRWESWAIRLQNSVASPSPMDSSQALAEEYRALHVKPEPQP